MITFKLCKAYISMYICNYPRSTSRREQEDSAKRYYIPLYKHIIANLCHELPFGPEFLSMLPLEDDRVRYLREDLVALLVNLFFVFAFLVWTC